MPPPFVLLHALFLEYKFFWTELLFLLDVTALSGWFGGGGGAGLEWSVTAGALSWMWISPNLHVLRSLFTNSHKIEKWEIQS